MEIEEVHVALEENINEQIKEKDYVILKKENQSRLIQIDRLKPVYIAKQKLFLAGVIGHPYGSTFEIKGGNLIKVELTNKPEFPVVKDKTIDITRDNRNLVDDQTSQKLTRNEIEMFKAEGLSGEKIIENLIENSSTFKNKTEYAQEKYLKKKKQKYLNYARILRPTTHLLAEMYYEQGQMKICNLRIDSLAQMLTMCNVRQGGRYIVVDAVLGLLAAAVLERLGTEGCVIQLYTNPGPVSSYRQAINALNLPAEVLQRQLFGLPLNQIVDLSQASSTSIDLIEEENTEVMGSLPVDKSKENNNIMEKEYSEKEKEKYLRRMNRQEEQKKAKEILKENAMDGLLIACKHHPCNILMELLDFLSPSSPFAIFCTYQTPLIECYEKLKEKENAIFLRLTESLLRNYQILPERTHPDVTISGSGGYLLTGIKVIPTT